MNHLKKIHKTITIIFIAVIFGLSLLVFAPTPSAVASRIFSNFPYVKSTDWGRVYVKAIPHDSMTSSGITKLYKVGQESDELLCTFNWYTNPSSVYVYYNPYHTKIVKISHVGQIPQQIRDAWQEDGWETVPSPDKTPKEQDIAITFYDTCKEVKSYSTLDIVNLTYEDPNKIPRSTAGYTIFHEVPGFSHAGNALNFDVVTNEGKTVTFNTTKGNILTKEDISRQKKEVPGSIKPCSGSGKLESKIINGMEISICLDNEGKLKTIYH